MTKETTEKQEEAEKTAATGASQPEEAEKTAATEASQPEEAEKAATTEASQQEEGSQGEDTSLNKEERYAFIYAILNRNTFIEPLSGDDIAKAYAAYDRNPDKMIKVLIANFQTYCRKCIREVALVKVKNELSMMLAEEAAAFRSEVIVKNYAVVKNDPGVEHLLVMMIFKNRYWSWLRFGLKEIFDEQREEPGNKLNTHLNYRFYRLKTQRKFKMVGDLVLFDIAEIVNRFKAEVLKKNIQIF